MRTLEKCENGSKVIVEWIFDEDTVRLPVVDILDELIELNVSLQYVVLDNLNDIFVGPFESVKVVIHFVEEVSYFLHPIRMTSKVLENDIPER